MPNVLNSDADLNGKTLVVAENPQTITGLQTFQRAPNPPFSVQAGSAKVANLDADKLDGKDAPSGAIVGDSDTQTLTNKRVNPRVVSTASSATPTVDVDATDLYELTALAEAATFQAPSGTPVNGQRLIVRIRDDGTGRALSWNAAFASGGIPLPTTTTANKWMHLGFIYNATISKWMLVASLEES